MLSMFIFGLSDVIASSEKPKVIRIACIADLSGPYAPITAPTSFAFLDACQYINDRGGIRGVKIEPVTRDCGGKVDVGISHYMNIRELDPRPLMLVIVVSSEAAALRERLAEDKIPGFTVTAVPAIYPAAYSFGWFCIYPDMFGGFVDWLMETWKESRPPRVAFLTWDTSYGRGPVTPETYAYAKKKGVEIVATELFGPRDVDVSTQLIRIRGKKADWIYTNTLATGPAVIVKSMSALKYKVNLAGGLGIDWTAMAIGGKELFEDVVVMEPFASWDDVDNPGVKLMKEYFEKNNRKPGHRTLMYNIGWALTLTTAEVINRAIDEVGWDGLDGEAVKNQMEKLKDYSPKGLTYYTHTPDKHATNKIYIARIKGGKILPITGWRTTPDLRPDKYK